FANGRTIRNRRFALWKIAENDAPDIFELAGVFEMEQNTIDLVRLHASIFKNDDRVCCVEFPGRAQRGFDKSHRSTEKDAFGLARLQSSSAEIGLPSRRRVHQGVLKR